VKKCSYCGGEYPDNTLSCPTDLTPLGSITRPNPAEHIEEADPQTTPPSIPRKQLLKILLPVIVPISFLVFWIIFHAMPGSRAGAPSLGRAETNQKGVVQKGAAADVARLPSSGMERTRIEGAFGLKLGAVFEPSSAKIAVGNVFGMYCQLNPIQTNKYFDTYGVRITPISHKIFSIDAFGPDLSFSENQFRMRAVAEAIGEKYGLKVQPDDDRAESQVLRPADTNYTISVSFDSKSDISHLYLQYMYAPFFQQAFDETQKLQNKAIKSAARDKSGL
jgi:hypothetical protein